MTEALNRIDLNGDVVPLTEEDMTQLQAIRESQPSVVPASVYDYQFAGQAAAEGIISDDDAMAWVGRGVVPLDLVGAVKEQVTDLDRQKRVLLFLAGTTVYPRDHELTPVLAATFGKDTPEKVDAFFLAASQR